MILTPEQQAVGRRNFLKASAALPAAGAFAFSHRNFGPVKCGVIGTGGEGRVLMECLDPKYIRVTAICDIRPDHLQMGQEVGLKNWDAELDTYTDYNEMLEKADIEAVIIASPLWQHAPMSIAALEAGKHVFCEKTMAKTIDDCIAMKETAEKTGLNLQIGHQRFYSPIYWNMYRMVMGGDLGDVKHIRCQWHRNNSWVRGRWWENQEHLEKYPAMKDYDPSQWGYGAPDNLCNWRLYEKHSEGLFTELASHMIAITNWLGVEGKDPEEVKAMKDKDIVVDAVAPRLVMATGGIYKFKNGEEGIYESKPTEYTREIEDHIYATFEYPNDLTVTFSSIQTNSYDGYYEMIMGTKGTVILSNETNLYLFPEYAWDKWQEEEEKRKEAEEAAKEGKATEVTTKEASKAAPVQTASASRGADVAGTAMGSGAGGGSGYTWQWAYRDELRGFAETIRFGRNNLCDGSVGLYAAQAVLGARQSLKEKRIIKFDETGRVIPAKA